MAIDRAATLLSWLASAVPCRCGDGGCTRWRCPGCAQVRYRCQGHGDDLVAICDFCWGAVHMPALSEPICQAAAEAWGQLRLSLAPEPAPAHLQTLQPWLALVAQVQHAEARSR